MTKVLQTYEFETSSYTYVLLEDYEELEAEVARLREALEDLYSMASSPQWRNEPLYRICELLEQALEQKDE